MKASEVLVVHEVALDGGPLREEPFLSAADGSFFVSRISELVVVDPAAGSLAKLPAKVEQLVGRGLHNVVVSLGRVGDVSNEDLRALMQVRETLDRCVGSLRLVGVTSTLSHKLGVLGVTEGVPVLADRDAAVADYRASLAGEPLDAGASEDLLTGSADGTAPAASGDWGWGSADEVAEEGPPAVDVAELLVDESELPKLLKTVSQIVKGGKRYLSLRLHLGRTMTSEDVDVLIACRDHVAAQGGQLALVSLPQSVLKWLKLLEFDREFRIFEGGDEADLAHRRHAAGERAPQAAAAKPAAAKPAAKPAAAKPSTPEPKLEFDSGVSLALGPEERPQRLVALERELEQARAQATQLKQQLDELRAGLRRAEAGQAQSSKQVQELTGAVRRGEGRVQELERERQQLEQRAQAAQTKAQQAEGEARSLREQLEAARKGAGAAGQAQDALRASQQESTDLRDRVRQLERELAASRQREAALLASEAGGDGDAGLRQKVATLQEERTRILAEAEQEIRRLSAEREMLRDELQSAGEMIERLGKELELS